MNRHTIASNTRVRHSITRAVAGFLLFLLVGCDEVMEGAFDDAAGLGSIEFRADGSVYITLLDATVQGTYEINGDRIIIHGPRGTQELLREGDALIAGPGITFHRRIKPQSPPLASAG